MTNGRMWHAFLGTHRGQWVQGRAHGLSWVRAGGWEGDPWTGSAESPSGKSISGAGESPLRPGRQTHAFRLAQGSDHRQL